MTLRIGNKIGMTLMEVMAATAILSLTSVFLYESFFISLDSYDYYANSLRVYSWAGQKVWEIQEELKQFGPEAILKKEGSVKRGNKDYRWQLSSSVIDENSYLCEIDLNLYWQQGKRTAKLSRSAYALYRKKE